MKNYSKKTQQEHSGPDSSSPGFRTPDFVRQKQSMFSGKTVVGGGNLQKATPKFSPGKFQHQHKG